LAADFAAIQPLGDEWQLGQYARWKAACELAAQNGALQFH
jgi:hypothetical protein